MLEDGDGDGLVEVDDARDEKETGVLAEDSANGASDWVRIGIRLNTLSGTLTTVVAFDLDGRDFSMAGHGLIPVCLQVLHLNILASSMADLTAAWSGF